MHRYLLLVVAMATLALAGCQHSGSDHNGAMQTSSSMACCGDSCKKMGDCCKMDDKGKPACSMGGNCCIKSDKMKM